MLDPIIYCRPHEIKGKLSLFDVTIRELQGVATAAVSARNEATPLHPSNAGGLYSYFAGVAALRMIFLQKEGWKLSRHKNIEAVENERLGAIILFQNVDIACGEHDPNPVSSKGIAIIELVDNPTGYLWRYMEEEDKAHENQHVWFFCVSCNGDEIRAELSRPRAISKNGNFGVLEERIFIIQDDDWTPIDHAADDSEEDQDFDVYVTKKG